MATTLAICVALSLPVEGAEAQQPGRGRPGQPPPRAQLEQRARQAYGRVLRDRVGLTPEQVRQLGAVNQRLAAPRQQLMREERAARQQLVQQVRLDSAADQGKVSALLAQLDTIQHRRLDLMEQEDRALAEFMSPLQRAKYRALQELVRRRMEPARRGGPRRPVDSLLP
jgi:hypothetical protein